MARLPRHFLPGLPAHLVHRGNNRAAIFRGEGDYLFFRHCLHAAPRFGVAIHSYVLMTNHVHLLATPVMAESLSKFIQSTARRYAGYFNARYERSGTLWEGRFHATVIQSERHLLTCHRYIDMNPVRAGAVAVPHEYQWSSHRHYAHGAADTLLSGHPVIAGLGVTELDRQRAYRALFDQPLDVTELASLRDALQGCRPMDDGIYARARGGRPRKTGL